MSTGYVYMFAGHTYVTDRLEFHGNHALECIHVLFDVAMLTRYRSS